MISSTPVSESLRGGKLTRTASRGGEEERKKVEMPRHTVRDKNDVITLNLQGGGRDN
jgi:hypothetical protein